LESGGDIWRETRERFSNERIAMRDAQRSRESSKIFRRAARKRSRLDLDAALLREKNLRDFPGMRFPLQLGWIRRFKHFRGGQGLQIGPLTTSGR